MISDEPVHSREARAFLSLTGRAGTAAVIAAVTGAKAAVTDNGSDFDALLSMSDSSTLEAS